MKKNYFLLFFLLILFSCTDDEVFNNVEETISPTAQLQLNYLNTLLDVMEQFSINRETIDWPVFRQRVLTTATGATTRNQLDPAIDLALTLLGDNHSFYQKSNGTLLFGENNLDCAIQDDPLPDLKDVGYIKVSGFVGTQSEAEQFARDIQAGIREQDRADLKGWVVDLRNNRGGNMWPMVAGIGPILGEGIAGSFKYPEGTVQFWGYFEGASMLDDRKIVSVRSPYTLLKPNPRVAILTNRGAASSGEAVIVAFKARPETRSFGEASCGVSTANQQFDLGDNTILHLTVATFADRAGTLYGSRITPDVNVLDIEELSLSIEDWFRE